MKKYKLIKELPGFPVWTIFQYDWVNVIASINWAVVSIHLAFQEAIRNLLEEKNDNWLEEIKEEPKSIYELKEGDTYWYAWEDLSEEYIVDNICLLKNSIYAWNVFLTKEEAEKEREKRKALAKIKRWIWENKIELSKDVWYLIKKLVGGYVDSNNLFIVLDSYKWVNEIVFNTEEDAEECLKKCENEWEILFDLTN